MRNAFTPLESPVPCPWDGDKHNPPLFFRRVGWVKAPAFLTGFTLIENLIYLGIVSMILVATASFLWTVVFGNIKEIAYQEVQHNARFALTKMTQEIKKANAINSPGPGFSDNTLSLSMSDPDFNPTVFQVSDGKLILTKGSFGPSELTAGEVFVSGLLFTNLSYPGTPGTVRIELNIDYFNQASISLNSTVSLLPGI